mmetsp:Transcript_13552/g.32927  ORF Transcript_13552/g.32927 Transcript_13552/m.32927 type:complete len:327 (-) Transcript_13552:994-1974(-)
MPRAEDRQRVLLHGRRHHVPSAGDVVFNRLRQVVGVLEGKHDGDTHLLHRRHTLDRDVIVLVESDARSVLGGLEELLDLSVLAGVVPPPRAAAAPAAPAVTAEIAAATGRRACGTAATAASPAVSAEIASSATAVAAAAVAAAAATPSAAAVTAATVATIPAAAAVATPTVASATPSTAPVATATIAAATIVTAAAAATAGAAAAAARGASAGGASSLPLTTSSPATLGGLWSANLRIFVMKNAPVSWWWGRMRTQRSKWSSAASAGGNIERGYMAFRLSGTAAAFSKRSLSCFLSWTFQVSSPGHRFSATSCWLTSSISRQWRNF